MYSKNVDYFSGRLRLQRQGELVSFACRDANPLSEMEHMSSFDFSEADTSLFFHLTMEVEDHSRMRHCEWDNFMIESGEVVFDDGS